MKVFYVINEKLMATTIGIMGDTGTGKTTSVRTLDPNSTYYINADGKSLSFKSWRKLYNAENRNYKLTSDPKTIHNILKGISEEATHIKVVVIDTINAIMLDDEMARMKIKGYDKWMDLAASIYNLINYCNKELRDDLIIVLMFHEESFYDEDKIRTTRILTNGRKLEKIKLETKLPILLRSVCLGEDGDNTFYFETQRNKSNAKSLMGLFEDFRIPNDLKYVVDKVVEYEN